MKSPALLRAFCVASAIACGIALSFCLRTYYSRYYSVAAIHGVMSEAEHARRLERSVAYDPGHGFGRLLRAEYLMKKGRLAEAEEELRAGMKSSRPIAGYLLQGVLAERQRRPEEARKAYEHVLAVVPGQVTALERLAVLAYEAGDLKKVEALAAEIARTDLNNPNPTYLRAVAAERAGDPTAAYRFYQKLSAAGPPPKGALYDLETIRRRLGELKPMVEAR